jgi:hypothetical protein
VNDQARKHLGRAQGFLARGTEFYEKAADEIIAAKAADADLKNREIGEHLGYGKDWARKIIAWREDAEAPRTPFIEPGRETPDVRGARRVLAQAPVEQVEQIIEDLPAERVAQIASAALGKPGVTRVLAKDPKASAVVTRASGAIREDMEHQARQRRSPGTPVGDAAASIGMLSEVLGPLLVAKRNLRDSYEAAREYDLNDEQRGAIQEGLDEIVTIIDWYRSFITSGDQSWEDELSKLLAN